MAKIHPTAIVEPGAQLDAGVSVGPYTLVGPHVKIGAGTTVAGFPNLFFLVGPNTGLGHNSIVIMIECQTRYILSCIDALDSRKARGCWPKSWRQARSAGSAPGPPRGQRRRDSGFGEYRRQVHHGER